MYKEFYHLTASPFSLLPDADFVFFSKRHRRALTLLDYGIATHAGFVVITGEVGAGKTTIIRRFLKNASSDLCLGLITNTSRTFDKLLHWVVAAFDLKADQYQEAQLYNQFVAFLVAQYGKGKRAVLIIDEAQNLSVDMLEELRMLSNINNEKDQLLQIVLVGQPELLEMLKQHEMRQFTQRISVHCHLDPLTAHETAAYIRHRLSIVGGDDDLFDDLACAAVYLFTGGVPRLINLLCDQTLVYSFSEDHQKVSFRTVAEVVWDRNQAGLSAYRAVLQDRSEKTLMEQLKTILNEIRAAA